MNRLCDQLQTTPHASAISPATILQVTLDTAQDPSASECQPEGAHFTREEEAENLDHFHAWTHVQQC